MFRFRNIKIGFLAFVIGLLAVRMSAADSDVTWYILVGGEIPKVSAPKLERISPSGGGGAECRFASGS